MGTIKAITNCNDVINAFIVRRQALTRGASQMQWGRPWWSASKPQGSLADKCNKGIVRASLVSQWYSYCNDNYHCKGVNCCKVCSTNTDCNVFLTSAGVKGRLLDAKKATIITVSMADANSTSSATMAVVPMTSATTRRVSPSTRTRASSPNSYRVSTTITCTTSACRAHGNNLYGQWRKYIRIIWIHRLYEFIYCVKSHIWITL